MFAVHTFGPDAHIANCEQHGGIDQVESLHKAREVIQAHAREKDMGLFVEPIHLNRVSKATGEEDPCQLPLNMCPHFTSEGATKKADPDDDSDDEDEAVNKKRKRDEPNTEEGEFKHVIVYLPIELALSEEVYEEYKEDPNAVIERMLHFAHDELKEPEEVAQHDPFAFVEIHDVAAKLEDDPWALVKRSKEPVLAIQVREYNEIRVNLAKDMLKQLEKLAERVDNGERDSIPPDAQVRLVLELLQPVKEAVEV